MAEGLEALEWQVDDVCAVQREREKGNKVSDCCLVSVCSGLVRGAYYSQSSHYDRAE